MLQQTLKRLADVLAAAEAEQRFTAGRSLADFLADEVVRAAVYYEFAIIGEALTQVRKADPDVVRQVAEHDRIMGFAIK